jgi:hypothetical protein
MGAIYEAKEMKVLVIGAACAGGRAEGDGIVARCHAVQEGERQSCCGRRTPLR